MNKQMFANAFLLTNKDKCSIFVSANGGMWYG